MMRNKRLLPFLIGLSILFIGIYIYKHNPYKVEYLGFYDKIWAHRVNNTKKLDKALKYFNGVELDLVYDNNVLYVRHPPSTSKALRFETYLESIPRTKKPGFWLDIKNLTKENGSFIYNHISSLLIKNNVPFSKVFIETRYPEALPLFEKNGFKTSYYLKSGLYSLNNQELQEEITRIKAVLEKQPNVALSFGYLDYDIISNTFPETKLNTWIIDSFFTHGFEGKEILKNKNVEIVLISYRPF